MTTDPEMNEIVQVKRGSITAYQTALANLQAKNADLLELLDDLEAENERLQTELNLLDAARTEKLIDELRAENERLRAEVRGLENLRALVERDTSQKAALAAENERLRAANEWLRELVTTESCPTCSALSQEDECDGFCAATIEGVCAAHAVPEEDECPTCRKYGETDPRNCPPWHLSQEDK
jgi:hypothetical protein